MPEIESVKIYLLRLKIKLRLHNEKFNQDYKMNNQILIIS